MRLAFIENEVNSAEFSPMRSQRVPVFSTEIVTSQVATAPESADG
jgi:hypothetical protein